MFQSSRAKESCPSDVASARRSIVGHHEDALAGANMFLSWRSVNASAEAAPGGRGLEVIARGIEGGGEDPSAPRASPGESVDEETKWWTAEEAQRFYVTSNRERSPSELILRGLKTADVKVTRAAASVP